LDRHDILFADGLPVESYLDTGNRGLFDNSGAPLVLHPDLSGPGGQQRREANSRAPLLAAAAVEPIWRSLAARAGLDQASAAGTRDPDLHIVAEGRCFRPIAQNGSCRTFVLPRLRGEVRLRSRSMSPADATPWVEDRRRLGVQVQRISFRYGTGRDDLALDDPRLLDGWWDAERDDRSFWRWTDGSAVLPLGPDAAVVDVAVGDSLRYPRLVRGQSPRIEASAPRRTASI